MRSIPVQVARFSDECPSDAPPGGRTMGLCAWVSVPPWRWLSEGSGAPAARPRTARCLYSVWMAYLAVVLYGSCHCCCAAEQTTGKIGSAMATTLE